MSIEKINTHNYIELFQAWEAPQYINNSIEISERTLESQNIHGAYRVLHASKG
jgi:hypothetical protein